MADPSLNHPTLTYHSSRLLPVNLFRPIAVTRKVLEGRRRGAGNSGLSQICTLSPSTQAKVLILGQLSFQRSTEAITRSRTFIRRRPGCAPQASTVLRRRPPGGHRGAVEVEDSKPPSLPKTKHPPRPGPQLLTSNSAPDPLFPSAALFPSCPISGLDSDKAQCVGF